MIYCGIDASTTSTGISILNDKDLIYYDCIKPKSKDWEERIGIISYRINEIFKSNQIEIIYIEDIPLKDGKLTIKKLSCVRGAIKSISYLNNIELDPRPINEWRQNAGFYDGTIDGLKRDAMKKKAVEEVKRLFGIDVNDDVAESILIAYRTRYPKKVGD